MKNLHLAMIDAADGSNPLESLKPRCAEAPVVSEFVVVDGYRFEGLSLDRQPR